MSDVSIARTIVAAVQRVPGVANVSSGRFAEAATYGPGEKVHGVEVSQSAGAVAIKLSLCALYAESLVLSELAARVRNVVRHSVEDFGAEVLYIDVAFDDLRVEEVSAGERL